MPSAHQGVAGHSTRVQVMGHGAQAGVEGGSAWRELMNKEEIHKGRKGPPEGSAVTRKSVGRCMVEMRI